MNWNSLHGWAAIATILSFLVALITTIATVPARTISIFNKNLPVGTIVASVLEYKDFREIVDGIWVPADGAKVPRSSKYYELAEKSKLPDMRGMFLRGLNAFEKDNPQDEEKKDPEGDSRKPGDYQPDSFKNHGHEIADSKKNGLVITNVSSGGGFNRMASDMRYNKNDKMVKPGDLDSFRAVNGGGKENRPKNVSVYFYIKIN